jgi:hypothetical protein
MELLVVCLRTTYFQADNKFFQQKDGMAMECCVSPIVSNIFMEHFEKHIKKRVHLLRLALSKGPD